MPDYNGNATEIIALDATTGDVAWTHDAEASLSRDATVADGTVYVGGRTDPETDLGEAVVVAVDVVSGDREWSYTFGSWNFDEYGPCANTPVIADGKVFTATYPSGSTIDHQYVQNADLFVLGSGDVPDDGGDDGSDDSDDGGDDGADDGDDSNSGPDDDGSDGNEDDC